MRVILLALFFLPVFSFGKPIIDDGRMLNDAVVQFLITYAKSDMIGVKSEIRNCYENKRVDKLYCLYFDYAARIADAKISEAAGFPSDEYFADELFGERVVSKVYLPRQATMEESNQHLNSLYTMILDKFLQISEQVKNK